jgi:UDP-glucose 4-epimerase
MSASSIVTGGAGFIGSYVADELLNLGHDVIILDDLSGGFLNNVPEKAEFVKGSITDHKLIDNLFKEYDFDYVYHLAAYAAEGLSHFIKRYNYNNNLIGSVNLINAAINHEVKAFVFTSSIAVYGKAQLPMTEDITPLPEDPYGIAKYAVELDLKASHDLFGLNYIIFRPHNVYGERQNIGDKYRNVIGIFINQLMQGKPMTVFGDGEQTRSFSYIKDIAPIIAKSVNIPNAHNEIFNIGAEKPCTINYLACIVADAMGENCNIEHLDPRMEVTHAFSSHEKAKNIFGDGPDTPLAKGIQQMAAWAKEMGSRKSKEFSSIEIAQNLPKSWIPK